MVKILKVGKLGDRDLLGLSGDEREAFDYLHERRRLSGMNSSWIYKWETPDRWRVLERVDMNDALQSVEQYEIITL